ncbi:MAG: hypothetical protein A2Z96_01295 [Spirochaetes bacterium GWB1_48_6]|nr:MAG: hypothetical protein A2Z96_01295 [Spirochaetes bacterium GWB1_48_6]
MHPALPWAGFFILRLQGVGKILFRSPFHDFILTLFIYEDPDWSPQGLSPEHNFFHRASLPPPDNTEGITGGLCFEIIKDYLIWAII